MICMFYGAYSFNQNINSWNVSKVENMTGMFFECKKFNQPLNNWNVYNVKEMSGMFSSAENFNQSIENWTINKACHINNILLNTFSFKDVKSILNVYFASRGNYKKKLLAMLENCDIKEVYKEVIKYNKLKDFIKKLENTYYDELKELIENKENILNEYKKGLNNEKI